MQADFVGLTQPLNNDSLTQKDIKETIDKDTVPCFIPCYSQLSISNKISIFNVNYHESMMHRKIEKEHLNNII